MATTPETPAAETAAPRSEGTERPTPVMPYAADFAIEYDVNGFVSVGGGSSMDTAKVAKNANLVSDLKNEQQVDDRAGNRWPLEAGDRVAPIRARLSGPCLGQFSHALPISASSVRMRHRPKGAAGRPFIPGSLKGTLINGNIPRVFRRRKSR